MILTTTIVDLAMTCDKKTEKEILDSQDILELIKLEPSEEIQEELENSLINIEKTLDSFIICTNSNDNVNSSN